MFKRLTPRFLEKVWGSTQLEPWFPNPEKKTGEVWLEGESLPLLVKFLFTTEPLSVQVHPEGKTEMWHVVSAEPRRLGARILPVIRGRSHDPGQEIDRRSITQLPIFLR